MDPFARFPLIFPQPKNKPIYLSVKVYTENRKHVTQYVIHYIVCIVILGKNHHCLQYFLAAFEFSLGFFIRIYEQRIFIIYIKISMSR